MRSGGTDGWRHRWLAGCCLIGWLAAGIAGCGNTVVVGLPPDYPPVVRKSFSLMVEEVEVESLTPTFRWQPLWAAAVPPAESETGRMQGITYELRIWQISPAEGGRLVYTREGLAAPEHCLETPLAPDTRYLWSVRAHFAIDGRRRTSEWSQAGYVLRSESVPNDSCLRFKTPSKERLR